MKITVKINKRNLNALVRKTNFNNGGMFISFQMIVLDFTGEANNTAWFYESTQASQNSYTNYSGLKIWDNANETNWVKREVLESIEENVHHIKNELEMYYPNINFKFINFDNI